MTELERQNNAVKDSIADIFCNTEDPTLILSILAEQMCLMGVESNNLAYWGRELKQFLNYRVALEAIKSEKHHKIYRCSGCFYDFVYSCVPRGSRSISADIVCPNCGVIENLSVIPPSLGSVEVETLAESPLTRDKVSRSQHT